MSRHKLNRRTLLRGITSGGLGIAVGLPLLDIMLNSNGTALADGEELPMQFMTWFFGNGVRLDKFEPSVVGPNWEVSSELAPLTPVKKHINVLTGLQNRCSDQITHHEGMTAFNGYDFVDQVGLYSRAGGPTIDQVIADKIGTKTAVKSVQVGVSKRTSIMDSGTTMHSLSHRSSAEPLWPEFNPQVVWQTLFGEFQPKPDDRALRKSVLDAVSNDVKKLKGRLGAIDNQRLDSHLTSIAELQGKIATLPPSCELAGKPTETNADVNDPNAPMMGTKTEPIDSVNRAMAELLVYAFKCDITRVASLMFLGGAAETNFADLGFYSGHHNNTHDPSAQNNEVHNGVIYIMGKLAYLLQEMEKVVDPMGKSLLDTGLVYVSSDCSEGLSHSIARQPVILAGNARGRIISPGIHYQATPGIPNNAAGNISDVLLTVLQAYDPTATSVGGGAPMSTTPLEAIRGAG